MEITKRKNQAQMGLFLTESGYMPSDITWMDSGGKEIELDIEHDQLASQGFLLN